MAKKVKCKKCRLEYDAKKYECPYCHKKRFNPTGLIIFLIILIIATGLVFYFWGDKIKELFIKKEQTQETIIDITTSETFLEAENNNGGLAFKNLSVTKYEDIYTIKFDIENQTGKSLDKEYTLVNLVDKVKAKVLEGNFIYWASDYESVSLHMMSEEIYKAEYNIQTKDEWKELEIFLREYDEETGEYIDIKVFTYENNFETITETETTSINIITE